MKIVSFLTFALAFVFSIGSANADVISTTLSCKQNRLSWNTEYRIDKARKTVLGMRIFNFNNGRPDGRYREIQGQSRVTFFKNGTVKYLKYGLYNDMNRLNRFEFYEMMGKLQMNGQLYAKCGVVATRKVSSRAPSSKTPNSSSSKSKNNNQKSQSNDIVSYRSKKWQTEWTNPDGSKSQTSIVLFNQAKPDGRMGTYGWSNGRFVGIYINNGARFEGKWVQDKSGQRCNSSVNGSFFHGNAWFQVSAKNAFNGKWSYCDDVPKFDWQGWID